MPIPYTSRELSERVEIEFQKRPNRFRRGVWWVSFWMCVACVAWLGYEGARGEFHIFEGGTVAQPHRLFENDCAKCHTTWAPVDRVLNLDFSPKVYSVENKACLACHPGSTHHDNQIPAHEDMSCAYCHIEHIGNHDLKRSPDRVCTECHQDLKTRDGSSLSFAQHITDFSEPNGHAEFAFKRLMASSTAEVSELGAAHKALELLEFVDGRGWQDRAAIKFNHSAHLKSERDAEGNLVYGIIGKDQRLGEQRFTDLSQACNVCHAMDANGDYMLPITYEKHCQECHPLTFDAKRYPTATVPHGPADQVRGFLTEQYTLAALDGSQTFEDAGPARAIPGRRTRPALSKDQADWLKVQVGAAEEAALNHVAMLGPTAKGGCAYCHTVEHDASRDGAASGWQIVPPKIPNRWMPHARFNHASHQLLNCAECHAGVDKSKDTGDVLMPGVELCRQCHSSHPVQPGEGSPARYFGARTDCVECHNYHDHSKDKFTGVMNPLLGASQANPDATSVGESSK